MRIMKKLSLSGSLIGLSLVASAWMSPEGPPRVRLGDDLIGMKVVSKTGESLGKIEDVVVQSSSGTSYAILSLGGISGMGDKLFAMPWTALNSEKPDTANGAGASSLVLSLDNERLKTAPSFDKKQWPTMDRPDWAKDVDTFYGSEANPKSTKPVEATARVSVISWRATKLMGTDVETTTGETLGDINELAIDVNGRVSYVVLSVGGFLGLGDRLVAVPWSKLKFSLKGEKGDKKVITLASTEEHLARAPEFKEGKENHSAMCDPKWIGKLYEYYSCPAYWKDAEAYAGDIHSDEEVKSSRREGARKSD